MATVTGISSTEGTRGPDRRLRFGIFMPPTHAIAGNQALQIERNLELIALADKLGFDEAWIGEHMTTGVSPVSSPELFLAAASQRSSRIKLGTAVSSVAYHHPFTLANRILDLDHLSRGRAMMGIGPGQSPQEGFIMGIPQSAVRERMTQGAEAIVRLLRGETVTYETEWFTLRDARLQHSTYNPEGIDVAVASAFTPSGSTLAGQLGVGLLSSAAGVINLEDHWSNLEKNAQANGHEVDRSSWRIVGGVHLAETHERARAEVRTRILPEMIDLDKAMAPEETWQPWMHDADAAIEKWTTEGISRFGGVATIGTPDEAIAAIDTLTEQSGGFGCYVLQIHHSAPWDATKRSLELFAEYVIPAIQQTNRRRQESVRIYHENAAVFTGSMFQAVDEARRRHGLAPLMPVPEDVSR